MPILHKGMSPAKKRSQERFDTTLRHNHRRRPILVAPKVAHNYKTPPHVVTMIRDHAEQSAREHEKCREIRGSHRGLVEGVCVLRKETAVEEFGDIAEKLASTSEQLDALSFQADDFCDSGDPLRRHIGLRGSRR